MKLTNSQVILQELHLSKIPKNSKEYYICNLNILLMPTAACALEELVP